MFVTPLHVSVAVAAPVLFVVAATVHSRVMFVGQTITGGTVSLKLIVCRHVEVLPQPSKAVQVRRMVPLPVQLVVPKASTKLMFVTPLHVSVAVAVPVLLVVAATVHSRVMFVGQTITGGTVSLKLIVCRHVEVLPQPSKAVQVRRMVPLPVQLVLPKASTKLMFVTPLQVSVAVAVPVLLVVAAMVHSKVMFVGQTITGGTVSLKLMVCRQVEMFPQPSNAVNMRRIV